MKLCTDLNRRFMLNYYDDCYLKSCSLFCLFLPFPRRPCHWPIKGFCKSKALYVVTVGREFCEAYDR